MHRPAKVRVRVGLDNGFMAYTTYVILVNITLLNKINVRLIS